MRLCVRLGLRGTVPDAAALIQEEQRQADIRYREWEEQQRRWRKEKAERKRKEASGRVVSSCWTFRAMGIREEHGAILRGRGAAA